MVTKKREIFHNFPSPLPTLLLNNHPATHKTQTFIPTYIRFTPQRHAPGDLYFPKE